MTKLEDYLEGVINIFHQYAVRVGDFNALSKGELKQLITQELANTIKSTKHQPTSDKIFQELGANLDGQDMFSEFTSLVASVQEAGRENIHKH
ncbi:protein S100-A12 [Sturnira hondurensis]|uniref:protein S100-A12 n=1 Tax=Sturnira hondurensis TaxID=192404 RepID=UPI0018798063|nr:protein S100-A12 [Sturnira hondurensis]